jgi:hypothetical protein
MKQQITAPARKNRQPSMVTFFFPIRSEIGPTMGGINVAAMTCMEISRPMELWDR